jgi:hypothetical protein
MRFAGWQAAWYTIHRHDRQAHSIAESGYPQIGSTSGGILCGLATLVHADCIRLTVFIGLPYSEQLVGEREGVPWRGKTSGFASNGRRRLKN